MLQKNVAYSSNLKFIVVGRKNWFLAIKKKFSHKL